MEGWRPEEDDEDFEIEAKCCFITGVSEGPPSEFDIDGLNPVRHGVAEAMINNGEMLVSLADFWTSNAPFLPIKLQIDECTVPMHPACFSMFKRLSLKLLGIVDIDGVYLLTSRQGDMSNRFEGFSQTSDLTLVDDQFYSCVPGTEYLVAHPLHIPGLDDLMGILLN